MGHGLEIFGNGQTAFFTAREPAWHRLGTVTPTGLSAEEALRVAHLGGWEVTKRPLMTTAPDGRGIPIGQRFATVRRNPDPTGPEFDVLGVVGKDYAVIQNEQAFAFLDDLVAAGEAVIDTAGSLDHGSKVFVTMRLPEPVQITEGDDLALYVAVATAHDGSAGLTAVPTPVRVVCQNTLSLALRGSARVARVRHDAHADRRMARARQIVRHTLDEGEAVRRAARLMLHRKVSVQEFDAVVAAHFVPIEEAASDKVRLVRQRRRAALRALFRDAPTQEVGRGTAWAAFNAVSEWAEWERPRHRFSKEAARSALLGPAAQTRRKAFAIFGPDDIAVG